MKPMRHISLGFISTLLMVNGASAQTGPNHLTGCLDNFGLLSRLAPGNSPASPCTAIIHRQITLKAEDPAGRTETIPFYITLDGNGAEQTISRNPPLSYKARCLINDGGQDRIRVIATSTVAGWYEEDQPGGGGPLNAGQEVVVFDTSATTLTDRYDNDIDEGSSAAANGAYLAIDGETLGLGVNVFGHDCVVVGTSIAIKGAP